MNGGVRLLKLGSHSDDGLFYDFSSLNLLRHLWKLDEARGGFILKLELSLEFFILDRLYNLADLLEVVSLSLQHVQVLFIARHMRVILSEDPL